MRTISLSPVRDPFQEGQLLQRTPSGRLVFDIASGTLVSRDLEVEGDVPGLDDASFQAQAEAARKGCVVSRALAGVPTITVKATLKQ